MAVRDKPRPLPVALVAVLGVAAVFFLVAVSGNGKCPEPSVHNERAKLRQAEAQEGAAAQQQQQRPLPPRSRRHGGRYMITTVMGLDPERLNVFIRSLRRHSPDTKLVVFLEEKSEATHGSLLERNGAEVIPFKQSADAALVLYRFELYKQYLEKLKKQDSLAGVALTDARDVLIQSDPWKFPLVEQLLDEDAMMFSLEGGLAVGDVPIRTQVQNMKWVDTCFGPEIAEEMGDAPISCAGITIGSVAAVYGYVDQLLDIAYNTASEKCRKYGSDQAIHNYMAHYLGPQGNLRYSYHIRKNWESVVHTAGYGWPIYIDRDGVYQRVNGTTPPIVHQYDRAYAATQVYLAMYPLIEEEVRWDGPECVRNLDLPTVKPCPAPPPPSKSKAKGKEKDEDDR